MDELSHSPRLGNDADLAAHGDTVETAGAAGAVRPPLPQERSAGQLIDRYGHPHSETIFKNWSPAAIKALGIRRVTAGGGAQ